MLLPKLPLRRQGVVLRRRVCPEGGQVCQAEGVCAFPACLRRAGLRLSTRDQRLLQDVLANAPRQARVQAGGGRGVRQDQGGRDLSFLLITADVLDGLRQIDSESIQCIVTSPPYFWLRDYQIDGQIGREKTPEEYLAKMVQVFQDVRRVLKKDGTIWLNLGDSYAGSGHGYLDKPKGKQATNHGTDWAYSQPPAVVPEGLKAKDLIGIPWRVALALQADGWWLRSDIIWAKPNLMPESVTDRPTRSHEYLFLLTKSAKYHYDYEAIQEEATGYDGRKDTMFKGGKKDPLGYSEQPQGFHTRGHQSWTFKEHKSLQYDGQKPNTMHLKRMARNGSNIPGHTGNLSEDGKEMFRRNERGFPVRNSRTVWTIPTQGYKEAHPATFPEELPRRCIAAGSREGDIVLDPFSGAGTTGFVAVRMGRLYIGIELNPAYNEMARSRIEAVNPLGLGKIKAGD